MPFTPGRVATAQFAAPCGRLRVDWHLCEAADPQAKGIVGRLQGYMETSFAPGRSFANELDFAEQLDGWLDTRANVRTHRGLRCRPVDHLPEDLAAMASLPAEMLDQSDTRAGSPRQQRGGQRWTVASPLMSTLIAGT